MKPKQRRDKLVRLLRSNPDITTPQLADALGAVQETVRNDLIRLEKQGVIERARGQLELLHTDEAFQVIRKSGALSKEERREEILNILGEKGNIRTKALASIFNVSEGTVRNDLIAMEDAGDVERRHGEVVLPEGRLNNRPIRSAREFHDSVRFVCNRALSLVEPGDQIFLDDSVCAEYIALHLPADAEVRVVTNSIRTATALSSRGYGSDIFILPGILQGGAFSIDVRLGDAISETLFLTKAFFSVTSAGRESGFFVDSLSRLDLFTLITKMSDSCYVLLLSADVGTHGHYVFPLSDQRPKLREVIVDNVYPLDLDEFFDPDLPITICGDNVVLKSPFHNQYVIGFSTLDGSHEFSQIVRKSIEDAAKEYSNIELVMTDNKMDPTVTLENVETFVHNNVDLVIEYSQDYKLGPLIAEKLSRFSIPLLAVDIPIPGAVYFGANNYQAGRLAGEAAAKEVISRWKGELDVLVVFTESSAGPSVENRIAGMLEAFRDEVSFNENEMITIDARNEMTDSSEKLSSALAGRTSSDKIAVFSFNAVATTGILESLRQLGMEQNAVVVSHNYMQTTAKELRRPDTPLLGTVTFSPELYGRKIMAIALKMLRKEPVEQLYFTDHRWVGRESIT